MQINRYSFPLSVHYIPEGIVHYMTECRQVTRRRRHKKKKKPSKSCTLYPGIPVQYIPESVVQYIPELMYTMFRNTQVSWHDLMGIVSQVKIKPRRLKNRVK